MKKKSLFLGAALLSTAILASCGANVTTTTNGTTTVPTTTEVPTTTVAITTTENPTTTEAPTTTVAITTTENPTTTEAPTTTVVPTTTETPTTTITATPSELPTTTVAPATTTSTETPTTTIVVPSTTTVVPSTSTSTQTSTSASTTVSSTTTKTTTKTTTSTVAPNAVMSDKVSFLEYGGDQEDVYVEWAKLDGISNYQVSYKKSSEADTAYKTIDQQLIRTYGAYHRADIVGISAGSYDVKVTPINNDGTVETAYAAKVENLTAVSYDRTGFAFTANDKNATGDASGAYNADGTLKTGAKVLYVSAATAKTVTMDVVVDSKGTKLSCTGLQAIITAYQKGCETTPLCVRFIGEIKKSDMDALDSSEEGLQIKGKAAGQNMRMTLEGIGEDAFIHGFGLLIRNCSNLEIRNLGFATQMDDDVSIDTGNYNIWVHDNDFYYGPNGSGDHAKGDGALDIKGTLYATLSYNHFYDTGKTTLNSNDDVVDYVSYHHNWYDHSDSRHPRVRKSTSIHVYNNYYDGNSKYGVGATLGSSIFVEANYFRNCKNPMLSSMQGTDIYAGTAASSNDYATFSKEAGGMIKSYGNTFVGTYTYVPYGASEYVCKGTKTAYNLGGTTSTVDFDAYEASTRDEVVPSDAVTKSGGTAYSNFDTASTMYEYTIQTPEEAVATVKKYSGRVNGGDFKWEFDNATEDTNYSVIPELRSALDNYVPTLVSIQGIGTAAPVVTPEPDPTPTPVVTTYADVIALIDALPAADSVTTANKTAINSARTAYNALDDSNKALVTNYSKLAACETALAALGSSKQQVKFTSVTGDNSFFTVTSANAKSGIAEKTYDGVTYKAGIKMESETQISFTITKEMSLLVLTDATAAGKRIKLTKIKDADGNDIESPKTETLSCDASGAIIKTIEAGTYKITKGDSINVYTVIVE